MQFFAQSSGAYFARHLRWSGPRCGTSREKACAMRTVVHAKKYTCPKRGALTAATSKTRTMAASLDDKRQPITSQTYGASHGPARAAHAVFEDGVRARRETGSGSLCGTALLDFITGPPSATPKDVFDIEAAAAPSQPEETASEASAVEEAVSDPIAACGTALIMEEGQDLADAVPAAFETAATGDAAPAADAPETPSEVGTIEEAGEAPLKQQVRSNRKPSPRKLRSNRLLLRKLLLRRSLRRCLQPRPNRRSLLMATVLARPPRPRLEGHSVHWIPASAGVQPRGGARHRAWCLAPPSGGLNSALADRNALLGL